MKRVKFNIKVTLIAPFFFPGVSAGRFGLDAVALRDHQRRPLIPQKQIKGIVRHGLVAMGHRDFVARLFGIESDDAAPVQHGSDVVHLTDNYAPNRGHIFFSDLCALDLSKTHRNHFNRVKIDEESGAAAPGQLMTIEQVARPEEKVEFTGSVIVWCDPGEREGLRQCIETTLHIQPSIGAMKSIGFGRIHKASVTDCTDAASLPSNVTVKEFASHETLRFTFTLDRPYLVDAERISENCFRGRPDIPGAALKGLLARALELQHGTLTREMSQAISNLRLSFAHPLTLSSNEGNEASAVSQSVIPASVVWDVAKCGFVDLSAQDAISYRPERQIDWKPDIWDKAALFWPQSWHSGSDERVHTEIDAGRGTAQDNMLFSTISLRPPKYGFESIVDLADVQRDMRSNILTALCGPLDGLGRTNASLLESALHEHSNRADPIKGGRVCLMLKTPGLLAEYSDSTEGAVASYTAFWKKILPHSELVSHFAQQRLVGGYQALRFRVDPNTYRPWLLTEPGSVFVFDLSQADVGKVDGIMKNGLSREALEGSFLTWKNCPFVAQNGFGAFFQHKPTGLRELDD